MLSERDCESSLRNGCIMEQWISLPLAKLYAARCLSGFFWELSPVLADSKVDFGLKVPVSTDGHQTTDNHPAAFSPGNCPKDDLVLVFFEKSLRRMDQSGLGRATMLNA